jgi:hypothetical protein
VVQRFDSARVTPLAVFVVLVLVAGCAGEPGQTSEPSSVAAANSIAPTSSPSAAPSVVPSDAPSVAPSVAVDETLPPSTEPTDGPAPTPKVTPVPQPSPTLNWDANGFKMSTKDPVSIGANAKVTLKGPVGPTCAIKVKYTSGTNASLPKPTHPNPGWWVWVWKIPASAHAGTATVTTTCTYAGDPHTGTGTFLIKNPALPDGWDIEAAVPGTREAADNSLLRVTVTIKGTVPSDPTHDQNLACRMMLIRGDVSATSAWISDYPWDNGDGPLVLDFDFSPLGPEFVGTNTWDVSCQNEYGDPETDQHDTGTIELT